MKRKKYGGYLLVVLFYEVFTVLCNILHCRMTEYRIWITNVWCLVTVVVWIVALMLWISLLKEIM